MSLQPTNDWSSEPTSMSGRSSNSQASPATDSLSHKPDSTHSTDVTEASISMDDSPMRFHNHFEDYMEIGATPEVFASYLDVHQDWFQRCAQPMQADPIDCQSYAITVGHFGAFNYYVQPKIGLELLPADQGVYRIRSVPVPDYQPPGYAVDFQASMQLVAVPPTQTSSELPATHVTWTLDLAVDVWFPRFIRLLPQGLIQGTGDRLLAEIVRQVSRRLTAKVQTDFHQSRNLPLPKQLQRQRGIF